MKSTGKLLQFPLSRVRYTPQPERWIGLEAMVPEGLEFWPEQATPEENANVVSIPSGTKRDAPSI